MNQKKTALYANAGAVLMHYDLDVGQHALVKRGSVTLPNKIQYAWPHASQPFLYAACSSRTSRDNVGSNHSISALKIDRATGDLSMHGASMPLSNRPVHVTTDTQSRHLLVAFNKPCDLWIFRINSDGTIGERVAQRPDVDYGIFAHQVRVTLDDRLAILVTRGNPTGTKDHRPHDGSQKDPGALKVFEYHDGVLGKEVSLTQGEGYRFGPRHLDFHPTGPWVYLSVETQNELHIYKRESDALSPEPLYKRDILTDRANARVRQGAGTVHVHPNGRVVYCANRTRMTQPYEGKEVQIGADNSLVAFSIDPATGEPNAIQHIDSRGISPRTFALDPSGSMLVAANSEALWVKEGDEVKWMPANLAIFGVREDGRLEFKRKYDAELGAKEKLLWMGIVEY